MHLLMGLNLIYNQYIAVSLSKNLYSPPIVSKLGMVFIFCLIFMHLMFIDDNMRKHRTT